MKLDSFRANRVKFLEDFIGSSGIPTPVQCSAQYEMKISVPHTHADIYYYQGLFQSAGDIIGFDTVHPPSNFDRIIWIAYMLLP